MDPDMQSLVRKRGQVRARISRIRNFILAFNLESYSLSSLKSRREKLEECWTDFNNIQSAIDALPNEEADPQADEYAEFEDDYFEIRDRIDTILSLPEPVKFPVMTTPVVDVSDNIKLPDMPLPSFSGKYEDWTDFHDVYEAMIHRSIRLSNIQKFYYLRSCLSGDAARAIRELKVTSDNYEIAWATLKRRFKNDRLCIKAHVEGILNLKRLDKPVSLKLKHLYDTITNHLTALTNLGELTDNWGTLLVFIIAEKLDTETRDLWETYNTKHIKSEQMNITAGTSASNQATFDNVSKPYSFKLLMRFIFEQSLIQEVREETHRSDHRVFTKEHKYKSRTSLLAHRAAFLASGMPTQLCAVCNDTHNTYTCRQLLGLTVSQRLNKVRQFKLCLNCLRKGHRSIQCKSPHTCKQCHQRHHTILHKEKSPERVNPIVQEQTIAACSDISGEVLLATVILTIFDNRGNPFQCRALLDSGSQANFISYTLASALGLKTRRTNISVNCLSNTGVSTGSVVRTAIKSRFGVYGVDADFLVLNKITNDLPTSVNLPSLPIPTTINLADAQFHRSRGVDILLGASVFYDTLMEGQIRLGAGLPILQNTAFGWVISGTYSTSKSVNNTRSHADLVCGVSVSENLDNLISAFWKTEEIDGGRKDSPMEDVCEQHYQANVQRLPSGQYVVRLPFLSDPAVSLGDSKETTFKRFSNLENKFRHNKKLKDDYTSFLNEYVENEEMEKVCEETEPPMVYYLPHHPVFKESSTTTKVRVVFDASSRSSSGISLNDLLMVGPVLQRDLFSLLLSFRLHKYVLTADIKQMYRKVLLHEEDCDYQRILWRDNPSDQIDTYRLKTVTYGIASAPFLAIRTLLQLADDEKQNFPLASDILRRDFYVDDVLTGADTIEQLLAIQNQLINLLRSGGFELRKWCANHPALLENISLHDIETGFLIQDGTTRTTKALGIGWQPNSDTFQYHIGFQEAPSTATKRFILSDISKIFDPIGLIAPVVVSAKLFMQELWSVDNLGWDDPVPSSTFQKWTSFRSSIHELNNLMIKRRALSGSHEAIHELHGFADASEKAYGACVYVRSTEQEHISIKLLCAKSKVAPLKQQSLPRLELCAALLLAQLVNKVLPVLRLCMTQPITLWTDSTIVLHWLNTPPKDWKTFVANRVSRIHELMPGATWKHVRSGDNPADLVSRGIPPKGLIDNHLWWDGPQWLSLPCDVWPEPILINNHNMEKRKLKIGMYYTQVPTNELLGKFSSWSKLLRVTALCQRFAHNCRNTSTKKIGHLTLEDVRAAECIWIKQAQLEFADEIVRLREDKPASNSLKSLSPYLDDQGIIRVGGRLRQALLSPDHKHPILLPAKHSVTGLIFEETHITTFHMGPQALLSTIRTKYWPVRGKVLARSVVRRCLRCSKVKPQSAGHIMGELPACRIQPSRPFTNCGIDYCGPFFYRRVLQRKSQPVKAYLALFICMATKAIHLEIVADLTTKKFLEALSRMIARRGRISNIYSDNGTTFKGANHELAELRKLFLSENHQHQLQAYCTAESLKWHFIPPYSPHFGGLWEAGVKTVKGHIKRVLGNHILMYDELETLFIQIEACVNSRPLTPLSDDPNDLSPLTPAHFLVGGPLASVQVPDLTSTSTNRLSHWQQVQQLYQHIWKRWSEEYLSTLQQRVKWTKPHPPLEPGTLVILKEDFRPPLQWDIGRIIQLHVGPDGVARVATVRTLKGLVRRAVMKLCPLPIS